MKCRGNSLAIFLILWLYLLYLEILNCNCWYVGDIKMITNSALNITTSSNHTVQKGFNAQPSMNLQQPKDQVSFSGAGPSKAEREADKAEDYLLKIIANATASQSDKNKALKRYEKAKKQAGEAQAIKETIRWMAAVGGAGAGFIATGDGEVATAVGTVLAATGDHLGNAMANLHTAVVNGELEFNTREAWEPDWSIPSSMM